MAREAMDAWTKKLRQIYGVYTGVFVLFVIALWIAEGMGLPPKYIGYAFFYLEQLVFMLQSESSQELQWLPNIM